MFLSLHQPMTENQFSVFNFLFLSQFEKRRGRFFVFQIATTMKKQTNVCFIRFFLFLSVTKLRKYYVIFVYILQGKTGEMEI